MLLANFLVIVMVLVTKSIVIFFVFYFSNFEILNSQYIMSKNDSTIEQQDKERYARYFLLLFFMN